MTDAHPNDGAIREQAYFLWEQDGRPHGREMEYWQRATVLAAEKEQVDTLTQAPPKTPARKKAIAAASKPARAKVAKAEGKAKPKKK